MPPLVKLVYQEALIRDPQSRPADRHACGSDEDLLREVNGLLQYDAQANV